MFLEIRKTARVICDGFVIKCAMLVFCGLLILTLMAGSPTTRAQSETAAARSLTLNAPVTGEITKGQSQFYRIALTDGQFLSAAAEQRDVDVVLSLFDPKGRKLAEANPSEDGRIDALTWVARAPGDYRLRVEVTPFPTPNERGTYQIKVVDLRTATPDERKSYALKIADAALSAADYLRQQATADSLRASLEKYKEALEIDKEYKAARYLNDLYWTARANYSLRQNEAAIALFEQRVKVAQEQKNRASEGVSYNWLGSIYNTLTQYDKALDFYQKALAISQELKDKREMASNLNSLGHVNERLHRYSEAVAYYEQELAIYRELGDTYSEVGTLRGDLGNLYRWRNQVEKAIGYYEQALEISKKFPTREQEGYTLDALRAAYAAWSRYDKAVEYAQASLAIARESKDRASIAVALNNLGLEYYWLGLYGKSIEYYQQAVELHREMNRRGDEGVSLNNIGLALVRLKKYDEAVTYFDQTVTIAHELRNKSDEASALSGKADVLESLEQYDEAAKLYQQALAIWQEDKSRSGIAVALRGLGRVALNRKDYATATEHLHQALTILREIKDVERVAGTLDSLMLTANAQRNAHLAIFYGKQAVNGYQEIRGVIKTLDKELREAFTKSNEKTYRKLADLLISQGRLPEAEQVLSLLKEEEYSGLLRRRAASDLGIGYSPAEAGAARIESQLAELGRERSDLLALKELKTLDATGERRLKELDRDLIPKANANYNRTLEAISREAPTTAVKTAEVKDAQALMSKLRAMGPGTVALYTIVSTEEGRSAKGWVMLITPDFRKAFEMDVKELDQTVLKLRAALRTPDTDPRPMAQTLYRAIFQTPQQKGLPTLEVELDTYLKGRTERTLMWSLDGVLRYVPMAVLSPDGRSYMLERYRTVVFTSASIPTLSDPVSRNWRALGLGVSKKYEGFSELKGTPAELQAIVREPGQPDAKGVLPGVSKLNEAFNRDALFDGLAEGYPVVHIASHFRYDSANPQRSFLLLGDGKHLDMSTLGDAAQIFEKTELLTLSACDTAMGAANGKDAEGLGFVAQKLGAQSVIASLWPVDDIGTQVLMPEVYRLREQNAGMSKAEALRQAQLKLLHGKARAGADEFSPTYAHPYYWAPFILIGNWR